MSGKVAAKKQLALARSASLVGSTEPKMPIEAAKMLFDAAAAMDAGNANSANSVYYTQNGSAMIVVVEGEGPDGYYGIHRSAPKLVWRVDVFGEFIAVRVSYIPSNANVNVMEPDVHAPFMWEVERDFDVVGALLPPEHWTLDIMKLAEFGSASDVVTKDSYYDRAYAMWFVMDTLRQYAALLGGRRVHVRDEIRAAAPKKLFDNVWVYTFTPRTVQGKPVWFKDWDEFLHDIIAADPCHSQASNGGGVALGYTLNQLLLNSQYAYVTRTTTPSVRQTLMVNGWHRRYRIDALVFASPAAPGTYVLSTVCSKFRPLERLVDEKRLKFEQRPTAIDVAVNSKKGSGNAVVTAALKHLRGMGVRRVMLNPVEGVAAFYSRFGFRWPNSSLPVERGPSLRNRNYMHRNLNDAGPNYYRHAKFSTEQAWRTIQPPQPWRVENEVPAAWHRALLPYPEARFFAPMSMGALFRFVTNKQAAGLEANKRTNKQANETAPGIRVRMSSAPVTWHDLATYIQSAAGTHGTRGWLYAITSRTTNARIPATPQYDVHVEP